MNKNRKKKRGIDKHNRGKEIWTSASEGTDERRSLPQGLLPWSDGSRASVSKQGRESKEGELRGSVNLAKGEEDFSEDRGGGGGGRRG